jgi:hypothetical protein
MHLGFEELDELAFTIANGGAFEGPRNGFLARNLGTIIELQWLNGSGLSLPRLSELFESRRVQLVRAAVDGQRVAAFESSDGAARLNLDL